MIDLKIGEHGRLYLLKHQKKFGVGNLDNYRDIEDFDIGNFKLKHQNQPSTSKIKNFRSNGLGNFRGTFPENKHDCEKVEVQSFLEHPKLSKSVQ